jgi:hypothetical protein
MVWLAQVVHGIFNAILTPLNALSFSWGIVISSLVTGLFMLVIFRWTSNQQQIRRIKDMIKALILEIRLYKDSPRIIMRAFSAILIKNLLYLRYAVTPLLFVFIPVSVILIQLHFRYDYRPVSVGETVLVKIFLKNGQTALAQDVSLTASDGLIVETAPLHIPQNSEMDWRLKVTQQGYHTLTFSCGDFKATKSLSAVQNFKPVAPRRIDARLSSVYFNPIEQPLTRESPFSAIEINYPHRINRLWGLNVNWLAAFFVLSLIFALALKGPLKVEI